MSEQPTLLNRILAEAEQAKSAATDLETALESVDSTASVDLLASIRMDANESSKKYLENTVVPFGGE